MSAQQAQIDLIIRWFTRILVGVSAFLISMYVYEMRNDLNTIKENVQMIKQEQSAQKEWNRNIERIVYK